MRCSPPKRQRRGPPGIQKECYRSNTLSTLVIQEGFEPPTHGLEGRCSIQLSYWTICSYKKWSGWWESNPRDQLGRLGLYHWATPASNTYQYVLICTQEKNELYNSPPSYVGRDSRIRTCDPLVPSEVRYQTALYPVVNNRNYINIPYVCQHF